MKAIDLVLDKLISGRVPDSPDEWEENDEWRLCRNTTLHSTYKTCSLDITYCITYRFDDSCNLSSTSTEVIDCLFSKDGYTATQVNVAEVKEIEAQISLWAFESFKLN
jgi:hypothetical protein